MRPRSQSSIFCCSLKTPLHTEKVYGHLPSWFLYCAITDIVEHCLVPGHHIEHTASTILPLTTLSLDKEIPYLANLSPKTTYLPVIVIY
jgi:hypothetical protein